MGILDPGGAVIARDTFLTDNAGITRMPTDQRAWDAFIIELNKHFRHEEGSFIATFNGFSADPDGPTGDPVVNWVVFGPMVNIRLGLTVKGTSNDTVFEVTNLPDRLKPDTAQIVWFFGGHDNTADTAEPISCLISNSNTLKFGLGADNPAGGGWTNPGTKGLTNANLSIMYSLWSVGM